MTENIVKIFGVIATVIGCGAAILSDWCNDKKMDKKIDRKVKEALAEREENEEES